jgi:hypothetical protein
VCKRNLRVRSFCDINVLFFLSRYDVRNLLLDADALERHREEDEEDDETRLTSELDAEVCAQRSAESHDPDQGLTMALQL